MTSRSRLQALLDHALVTDPEKVAIRFGLRNISYRELDRQAGRIATGLRNSGVAIEDRVALLLPNCPEAVAAMFACYKIGAVAVPLNYRYLAPEARYVIEKTNASVLIFHEDRIELAVLLQDRIDPSRTFVVSPTAASTQYASIDLLLSHEPLAEHVGVPADHPALILYTSGSTGRPRGVVHSHTGAFCAIDSSRRIFNFNAQDIVLVGKSISHAGGLQTQLMPTLLAGAEVVLAMTPSPPEAVALIAQHAITQYAMLASDLLDFIEHLEQNPTDLPTLRNSIGSGDSVPTELHHRFRDVFGWEVMEGCRNDRSRRVLRRESPLWPTQVGFSRPACPWHRSANYK